MPTPNLTNRSTPRPSRGSLRRRLLAAAMAAALLPGASAFGQAGAAPAEAGPAAAAAPAGLAFVGVGEGGVVAPGARLGVRGPEGTTALTLVLENGAGEPVATGSGRSAVALMTGPAEARRPWSPADAAPGVYRLRARGLGPDRGVLELSTEVTLAAPTPFRASFPEDLPGLREAGDRSPLALEVRGTPGAGEDLLVVAWDPERLEMREGFAHVLTEGPWEVDGERLAALETGPVELQVMRRRGGEVLGVREHGLDVMEAGTLPRAETPALSLDPGVGSAGSTASGGGGLASASAGDAGSGLRAGAASGPSTPAPAPAVAEPAAPPAPPAEPQRNAVQRITPREPSSPSTLFDSFSAAPEFLGPDGSEVPAPLPTPEPAPTPRAEPVPTPTPEPAPTPRAEPVPTPTPEPAPTPRAEPVPAPTPEPAPTPRAEPEPEPTPEPEPAPTPQSVPTAGPGAPGPEVVAPESPQPTPGGGPEPQASNPAAERPGAELDPPASDAGFTSFPVAGDARVIYLSSSRGSDANNGLSPERPVATAERAKEFLRDGYPDRLLIKAGDVFEGPLGFWSKSGRSASEPMVVSTYGEGDRPLFRCGRSVGLQSQGGEGVRHVLFQGFELLAHTRVPGSEDFLPADAEAHYNGIVWRQRGGGLIFEDLKVSWFTTNMEIKGSEGYNEPEQDRLVRQGEGRFSLRGVLVNRCIFVNAYSGGRGHSQGLFSSDMAGLEVRESVFDHNGWAEGVPEADRTLFNHNLYHYFTLNAPVKVVDNLILRGASHGAQVRPGGEVRGNLFVKNALALMVCDAPSVVTDNVILQSDDIGPEARFERGLGIETFSLEDGLLENNLIAHKASAAGHTQAIVIDLKYDVWYERIGVTEPEVTIRRNTIYNWTMRGPHQPIRVHEDVVTPRVEGNLIDLSEPGDAEPTLSFVDPERDVAAYMASLGEEPSLERFAELAAGRPRGVWVDKWSAKEVNRYIRDGYRLAPFD